MAGEDDALMEKLEAVFQNINVTVREANQRDARHSGIVRQAIMGHAEIDSNNDFSRTTLLALAANTINSQSIHMIHFLDKA